MKIFEITKMDPDPLGYWKSMGYRYGVPIDYKPAPYVWSDLKLAYKEAHKKNKKVVHTVTGKYKLADLDDPAPAVIPQNIDSK